MYIGGYNMSFVDQVVLFGSKILEQSVKENHVMVDISSSSSNRTEFITDCQTKLPSVAADGVCIFLDANNSYTIFYGGTDTATPWQPALAGAQYIVNTAIITGDSDDPSMLFNDSNNTNSSASSSYPFIEMIQQTPRLLTPSTMDIPIIVLLVQGIMHVLATCVALQFLIGPIVYEKINQVRDSILMVGVKLGTYLVQWNVYYGLNSLITTGVYTVISIYWNVFPLSSPFLIFMSHFCGFIQLNAFFILLMQFQTQEESAQSKPWIFGLLSMAIGSALLVLTEPTFVVFYILSVFLPFVGVMQYYAIYITYDVAGYDTGIHLGENVVESGLLGVYIAQVMGITLYLVLTGLYSSERFTDWITNHHQSFEETVKTESKDSPTMTIQEGQDDRFEPLLPGSDVLLSVRGLEHTYLPPRFNCDKNIKPEVVLKGLNFDVCRSEVFGYLGHNVSFVAGQPKFLHIAVYLSLSHVVVFDIVGRELARQLRSIS
jgi:hypothetical protein